MKELKPKFVLTRVYDDGSQDAPEITPLAQAIDGVKMNRRGFFGAGLAASAAVAMLDSCAVRLKWDTRSTPRPEDSDCGKTYAHCDDIVRLAVDGSLLVSVGKDKAVKCWDLSNRALLRTFDTASPSRIAIGATAMKVAFGVSGSDNELHTLPVGELIKSFEGQCYEFTPDNTQLIVGRKGYLDFYNPDYGTKSTVSVTPSSDIRTLAVSPQGNYIAVATGNKGVHLLDSKGNAIAILAEKCENVNSLAFSPNEQSLALVTTSSNSALAEKTSLIIVSIPDGGELFRMSKNIDGLLFSAAGEYLFWTGPEIGGMYIGSFVSRDMSALANELTMAVAPDGQSIITGGRNGSIKIRLLPDLAFSHCLMDVNCSGAKQQGATYNYTDEWGRRLSFTLPCGSPIPADATCTCNCVPGKMENICTCDRVCTCNRVCTCLSVGERRACTCNRVCTCLSVGGRRVCTCNRVCTCLAVRR
jgi:WD40 repeat protein